MVAMQATWSQPLAEVVVFSNGFARRGSGRGDVVDLDAPGVPDGPEDRLLVVPPHPAVGIATALRFRSPAPS